MSKRLAHSRQPGQSLPVIAAVIVVVVAMIGLGVDIGNTYAEQRATVRAADAAAVAAMSKMITNADDATVGSSILQSFTSNGVPVQMSDPNATPSNVRTVQAYYLDEYGVPLRACQVGSCGAVPTGATYLQIKISGKVDTFFARVMGQNTLPIKAQSFAGKCAPTAGVYPIAVKASDLNENGFVPPPSGFKPEEYKQYNDSSNPKTLIQRRIYVKAEQGADPPGSFSYLRWQSDPKYASATELAASLTGDGNVSAGFDESTWPSGTSAGAKPTGYPLMPKRLSQGDWIYGNPGWSSANSVTSALDVFVKSRREIILPIVDATSGSGVNSEYHFQRLGRFYLVGYSDQGGKGAYFDMVYLGDASSVACLATNLETLVGNSPPPLGVTGAVWVKPRWTETTAPKQPIQYVFVMDFSGSMNWNFAGMGWDSSTNTPYQCEKNIPGATYNGKVVAFKSSNCPGTWNNAAERRVMLARNAAKAFVDQMSPNDTLRIAGYAMNDTGFDDGNETYNKISGNPDADNYYYKSKNYKYTWAYPPENAKNFTGSGFVPSTGWLAGDPGWTTDKTVLKKWIDVAGPTSDPKVASGGTPGANGVKLAIDLLKNAPATAPDGKTYKKVIIYLTDGVANVFLDGKSPKPSGGAQNNYYGGMCGESDGNVIVNTPVCQINRPDVTYPQGWSSARLPITAMTDQTDVMKAQYLEDDTPLMIFTIAIGTASGTGLDMMASEASLSYVVNDPAALDSILSRINTVAEGSCQANSGPYTPRIADANKPDTSLFKSPNTIDPSKGQYGWAYLYDQSGTLLSNGRGMVPIVADAQGNLGYSLPPNNGLAPGLYKLKAFVGYKGADGVTRQYDSILNLATATGAPETTFVVTEADALGKGVVLPPVYLDLPISKTLCP